jgi:hypothetical protein
LNNDIKTLDDKTKIILNYYIDKGFMKKALNEDKGLLKTNTIENENKTVFICWLNIYSINI